MKAVQQTKTEGRSALTKTGVKYDAGKLRLSLVPPEAIEALGAVLTYGENKYDAHNWLRGLDHSRVMDAALRHLMAYQRGEDLDLESGMPHLWHALTNIAFLVSYHKLGVGTDDRRQFVLGWAPKTTPKGAKE